MDNWLDWYVSPDHSELDLTEIHAEVDEIRLSTVLGVIDSELDGWRSERSQGAVIG